MTWSATIALCQDCDDTISAYDIMSTHQAKRCPACFAEWKVWHQSLDPASLQRPFRAGGLPQD
ncbi:MAG: hypothetical protein M1272_05410 [Firmicutes bacterium]|nr:hypothetical protein [Bacillota bacterium]